MRPTARALALTATTALAVGGLAAPAYAASPVIVSATPAPDSANDAPPSGVSITWDQSIATSSTISVSGPPGASACTKTSPVVVPSATLSCQFTGVPSPSVPDGTYTVSYTANSTGGDPATAGSYIFEVDTVAPVAPTGVTIAPDPYNGTSTTLAVSGSSESADDTVQVEVTSGAVTVTQTVDAGAGGAFTATFSQAQVATLPDGTVTASAASTDAAGNAGPATTATATKDTVAASLVTTSPANGGSAQSAGFTYSATGSEPLGTTSDIDLFTSGGLQLATTTPLVTGSTVSVSPVGNLSQGSYTANVILVDGNGNVAAPVSRTFTIDNAAPAPPDLTQPLPPANQANSDAFPVSGTGEAGAAVTVTVTDAATSATGTATVAGNGTWSTTVDVTGLVDGPLSVTAAQTDGAGNDSDPSAPATTTKDTVAPATPTVAVSPDPISQAAQTSVTVSGSSNGDSVDLTFSDGPGGGSDLTASVPVSAGAYSTTFDVSSLADGTVTASAVARDTAGNSSGEASDTATKDTAAPATPGVSIDPDPINDDNQTSITVSGTSDGATVDVVLSDGPGGGADLTAADVPVTSGSYSAPFNTTSLADGTVTATVVASDPVGNTSGPGTDTATKDTEAPTTLTVLISPDPVNDASKSAVSVSGTSDGDSVAITVSDGAGGGADLVQTVAVTSGSYAATFDVTTLADGQITASVTASDAAGNSGTPVSDSAIKDTLAPGQPATLSGTPSPYEPSSTTLTVSGTTAAGDSAAVGLTVDITVSDGPGGGANLTANDVLVTAGVFTTDFTDAQVETLADGELTITAAVSDPAGNTGPQRTATAVKDTTTFDLVSTSPADGSTVAGAPTVSATYTEAVDPATSTITVQSGGLTLAGSTSFDGSTITFTPSSPLNQGGSPYSVTVNAEDPDTAETSDDAFTFSIDSTAPPKPTITSVTNPVNDANKTNVSVSGNAGEAGVTVTVTVSGGGTATGSATSTSGGAYTVSGIDVTPLADGALSVTAVSEDGAGNDSPASDPAASVKDTVGPTHTASTPADGSTVTAAPTVTITFSEPLGSGSISIPGVPGASSFSGGTVTFTPTAPLGDGTYTATASVTDARGNPGTGAATFTVNDAAAPSTTTLNPLPAKITYGRALTLAGKVTRSDGSSAYGQVQVTHREDSGVTRVVAMTTPAADGSYSTVLVPSVNGTYTATYLGDAENATSSSETRTTNVKVLIKASSETGPWTKRAVVKGSVSPNKSGKRVRLYSVLPGSELQLVGTTRVKPNGRFAFRLWLPKGTFKLLVRINDTQGNLGNKVRLTAVRI